MYALLQAVGVGMLVLLGVLAIARGMHSVRSTHFRSTLLNTCEVQTLVMNIPLVNVGVWTLTDRATIAVCVIGNGLGAIYFAVTKLRHDAGCKRFANDLFGEYRWLASFLLLGLCLQAGVIYCNRNSYLFLAEILTLVVGIPYAVLAQRRWMRTQARQALARD